MFWEWGGGDYRIFSFIASPHTHSPKNVVLVGFSNFFKFVPRITPLQIELGSWNLICTFNIGPIDVPFGSVQLFSLIAPLHKPKKMRFWSIDFLPRSTFFLFLKTSHFLIFFEGWNYLLNDFFCNFFHLRSVKLFFRALNDF